MPQITVCVKSIAIKQPVIAQEILDLEHTPEDVRSFITEVVKACVKAYKARAKNEILKVLSQDEIDDAAVTGKISFGINYGEKQPVLSKAISNAIQSFEDGIFCIFSGDKRLEELDDPIELDKPFTFIRLTMLSGRMW